MALKDIRGPLRSFLLSDPDIATAVGNSRIFLKTLPQGERRASLVYMRPSEIATFTHTGADTLVKARMQIDAWAPNDDAAAALADNVKELMNGYRGAWGTVEVQGVFMQTISSDDYDSQSTMFRVGRDYLICYLEI